MLTPKSRILKEKMAFSSKITLRNQLSAIFLPKTRWIIYSAALLIMTLSSCQPRPTVSTLDSPAPSTSISPAIPNPSVSPSRRPRPRSGKTITVNLYKIDRQCLKLVPEKTVISAVKPVEAAVSQILESWNTADFELTGYRTSVNNGVATIDLRLAPNSKRKFQSLSICEQLALFGGIRQSLTRNAQFKVKSVRFLEKGKEIVL